VLKIILRAEKLNCNQLSKEIHACFTVGGGEFAFELTSMAKKDDRTKMSGRCCESAKL
jgi:hypothetical protein